MHYCNNRFVWVYVTFAACIRDGVSKRRETRTEFVLYNLVNVRHDQSVVQVPL